MTKRGENRGSGREDKGRKLDKRDDLEDKIQRETDNEIKTTAQVTTAQVTTATVTIAQADKCSWETTTQKYCVHQFVICYVCV